MDGEGSEVELAPSLAGPLPRLEQLMCREVAAVSCGAQDRGSCYMYVYYVYICVCIICILYIMYVCYIYIIMYVCCIYYYVCMLYIHVHMYIYRAIHTMHPCQVHNAPFLPPSPVAKASPA